MDNTKIGLHVKCIHSLASSGIKTMKHNSGRHRMCLGDCFSTTCSLGTEKHWRRALTPSTDRGRQGSEGQELTQNQKQQPPPPCREEDGRVFVCIAAAIKMNALSSRSSVSIAKSCFNGEGQNLLGNCTAKIRNFILSLSPSPSLDGENMMQWQKETINVNDQEESHEQVYTSSLRLRKDCPLTPISPTEVKRLAHKTAQETGKKNRSYSKHWCTGEKERAYSLQGSSSAVSMLTFTRLPGNLFSYSCAHWSAPRTQPLTVSLSISQPRARFSKQSLR